MDAPSPSKRKRLRRPRPTSRFLILLAVEFALLLFSSPAAEAAKNQNAANAASQPASSERTDVSAEDTAVGRVKSKLQDKIQGVRDHHPLVDKTASVLARTAHAIDDASHRAMESEAGQATIHKAKDLYAKASEGAGSAVHKVADRVAPSASARYVSDSSHARIGGVLVLMLGAALAFSTWSCYRIQRQKRRRTLRSVRKEKADLDYHGGDIEGGAVFRDDGDKQQPFQLYHEFEYKMRRRYQGSNYSYATADSPPQYVRNPPQSTSIAWGSKQQSNTYTYQQQRLGKNGEPVKDKPKGGHKGGGNSPRRRLLTTALGVVVVGYVGISYAMPADMTLGDIWLLTAEFVDAKLGHHGLVL